MRLDPSESCLLLVDFQERLHRVMPDGVRERVERAASNLLFLAQELELPVVQTEQYPEGLGPSLESLRTANPLPKMTFSAARAPGFALTRGTVILCGEETHICVTLTALDLRSQGHDVIVVPDACASRRKADWRAGIEAMRAGGASVLPSETVLFGLLERAGGPLFKEVSRRIR